LFVLLVFVLFYSLLLYLSFLLFLSLCFSLFLPDTHKLLLFLPFLFF
jgi:hypothetical protein